MTRRQLVPLAGLILVGTLFSYFLKDTRTLGRSIGDSPSASLILRDKNSPQVIYGDGNLTVVLFTDYQCPSCRKAASALSRAVKQDGNITLIYKEWPILGEHSQKAAKVALAAHRQGIYFSLHHLLMNSGSLNDAALRASVENAGGDWAQLEADLHIHGAEIADQLARNSREAFTLGVQGTPSYLVGPLLIEGALTESELVRAFEQVRAER